MAVVSAKMVMVACIVLMAAISVAALTEDQITRGRFPAPLAAAPAGPVSAPQPSSSSSAAASSGSPSQNRSLSISPSHAPASAPEAKSSAVQNVAGVLGMVATTVLIMAMA